MKLRVTGLLLAGVILASCAPRQSAAGGGENGYFSAKEAQKILDKTLTVRLQPDLAHLSLNEREALNLLLEVGDMMQRLYEDAKHYQSPDVRADLANKIRATPRDEYVRTLNDLYYLFEGPIARTLDGTYTPFVPVDMVKPGGTLYPWGIDREELDTYFAGRPAQRDAMLHLRSVVRRGDDDDLVTYLANLDTYAELNRFFPHLEAQIKAARATKGGLVSVPYAVAYADDIMVMAEKLDAAADAVSQEDPDFAQYLRLRARDLVTNDYEAGDASWVTGSFKNLNAQIGAYETYDDGIYGVKAYWGLSVLVRDIERSKALASAITGLQEFENKLPYEPKGWTGGNKKFVRENIPVGVYDVVADFGQARGSNTATILPNDPNHARKYGRTILIRSNILRDDDLFAIRLRNFQTVVTSAFDHDLTADGAFNRTLWHEIGHYLGPATTHDGRDLNVALGSASQKLEELKADLVSLFLVEELTKRGYYTDAARKSVYASGVRRTLLKAEPKPQQTYQTMELMQFNYFLANGLVARKRSELDINYARVHDVVGQMLQEVLALQYRGDENAANEYIARWTKWDSFNQATARALRDSELYRYVMVKYAVLGALQR